MIEEMEKTESQWKNLPNAARNRILIKKWKDQAQVRINLAFKYYLIKQMLEIYYLQYKSTICLLDV